MVEQDGMTARDWLAEALKCANDPDVADRSAETDALVWSVATSLADIADAMKGPPESALRQVRDTWVPPVKLPEEFQDGQGNTWERSSTSMPHYRLKRDYFTPGTALETIRERHGIPSMEPVVPVERATVDDEWPDRVVDVAGDRWARIAGTDRYVCTEAFTPQPLSFIREQFGLRGNTAGS